jgi:hypothetical protein
MRVVSPLATRTFWLHALATRIRVAIGQKRSNSYLDKKGLIPKNTFKVLLLL